MDNYLPYISDDDLKAAVKRVIDCIIEKEVQAAQELHKNVVDPFSAVFDGVVNGLSLEDWLEKEKTRQTQKSVQNKIGEFHEDVLSCVAGWEKASPGVDIRSKSNKIIAEIKNKHNTVKGSEQYVVYDYLKDKLSEAKYKDFTAYYVEIVPSKKQPYDISFTPSDRKTGQRRPDNPRIRKISGQAFYALVTGYKDALLMLFRVLPDVISDVISEMANVTKFSDLQRDIFQKSVANVTKFSDLQRESFQKLFDKAF